MAIRDFYRGDTQIYKLRLTDPEHSPIDLTGCTIWFTMKLNPDDPDSAALIQKVVTTHTNPTNGETKVSLTAEDTAKLIPGKCHYYDFQYKSTSDQVVTLEAGRVTILRDITQVS